MAFAFQKLLVGVAFDDQGKHVSIASRRAIQAAMALAKRTGGSLTLFHSTADDGGDSERPVVQLALSEHSHAVLEEARKACEDDGVPADLQVAADRPWLEMTRSVLAGENDFVVIARRNDAEDEHVSRLGVNSIKLLRNCPCPVMVVRPDMDPVLHRILAATDISGVGTKAVNATIGLARLFEAEAHVVHAWQMPFELQFECGRASVEQAERLLQEHESGLRKRIRGAMTTGDVPDERLHIGCCSASRGILDAVEKLNPDLLVMGTLSRSKIPGLLVGNTAERLLDRVRSSILAVKPDDFECPVH